MPNTAKLAADKALKAKRDELMQQYNEVTKRIQVDTEMRLKILGALELLEQLLNDTKEK